MSYQLLIADDHPLFRDALTMALQTGELADCRIELASTLDETRERLSAGNEYDLLLLDLRMPGSEGFFGLVQIRKEFPEVPLVVISGSDDPVIVARTRALGALGFIAKSTSTRDIQAAVARVLAGDEVWPEGLPEREDDAEIADIAQRIQDLTDQQLRVLQQLQRGRLNKQIAYDLSISEATVKAHVTAIFRKLGVLNRTQAVILANRLAMEADPSLPG
ncbi:response regulator transcription factor [Saccharospirillum sp. HFRX-1]|uniref:response regulator transcription factor n=1 Tax=unclassified Saccharospirillum TaxID=2633430 RepID=UPI00372224D9